MNFRFPGWGIGWFTPLLVLFAPIVAYGSYTAGSFGFAVFWLLVGVCAALTWFQQRWAAIPLIMYFSFVLLGVAMSFAADGLSLKLAGALAFTCTGIYELVSWFRSPADRGQSGIDRLTLL